MVGQEIFPVRASNRIGKRSPGLGDLYFGLAAVLSFSVIAVLPFQAQSSTVASYAMIWPFSSSLCPGFPMVGNWISTQSFSVTTAGSLFQLVFPLPTI